MIIGGIDTETLPDQFQGVQFTPGRVLILDGDGPAYRATASAKKLSTALSRFETEVLSLMFLTGSDECRVFLTPKGCVKCERDLYPTKKLYQGNRKSKAKPPLLEVLRQHLIQHGLPHRENWEVFSSSWFEADDLMMMHSYILQDQGVVWSDDKDLCMTPHPYWLSASARRSVLADTFGFLTLASTDAGQVKVKGHGRKFFWAQMLMGDTADNVRGIDKLQGKLCGPAGAYSFLQDITDERECAVQVLTEYARIGQDPLAEAECLWLRRDHEDSAFRYFTELQLPEWLNTWIVQLHEYHEQYKEVQRERLSEASAAVSDPDD